MKSKEEIEADARSAAAESKAEAADSKRAARRAGGEARDGAAETETEAAPGLLGRLIQLSHLDLPDEVIDMAGRFVRQAEEIFQGEGKSSKKQRFAVNALRAWLAERDIKQIPDWVETPLERAFATLAVQLAFRAVPGLRSKAAKVAA